MKVEIDQSGRLEHLNTDTVIAYSNGKKGSVLIKVGVKRELVIKVKKSAIPNDQMMPMLFAACIYLLIQKLDKQTVLIIDEEYTGKERIIKSTLEKLMGNKWEGDIRFVRVGKSSPAHHLAWTIHRHKLNRSKVKKFALHLQVKTIFSKPSNCSNPTILNFRCSLSTSASRPFNTLPFFAR